jgi:N6-adenosine-specific RNA methylase IME4
VFEGIARHNYGAILADPPWHFRTWSERNQTRSAARHYQLMSLDEIANMPVADLAADNCALFLWAINPLLPEALKVMEQWGFKFKTVAFVWAKSTPTSKPWAPNWHMGLGYYTRANAELCLLGTKGRPHPKSWGVRQLIVAPRREHSRKPEAIYNDIPRLVKGPHLELFGREKRKNWDVWGNQSGKWGNSKLF